MSCPKLRFAISFFVKLEKVTGTFAFTRTAETRTSSKTVLPVCNSITYSSSLESVIFSEIVL